MMYRNELPSRASVALTQIDIEEIDTVCILAVGDEFGSLRHLIDVGRAQLDAEQIFALVSPQQRVFREAPLEDVIGDRHFSTGDIRSQFLAHSSIGQIAHRGQGC